MTASRLTLRRDPGEVRGDVPNAGISGRKIRVALCSQVARLLMRLLGEIPYDRLRYADRRRLIRLLQRVETGAAAERHRLEVPENHPVATQGVPQ